MTTEEANRNGGDGGWREIEKELARQRREARQVVREFVESAVAGDCERMVPTFDALDAVGGWARAMRAVARLGSVPNATREFFLRMYIKCGDHMRQQCEDLALADGLRVLLPKYDGPAMRLYRGESFRNRSRRTYGLSWTANADVARQYAERAPYRVSAGGAVLLETLAPPDTIICAPALLDDRYAEEEYIVDRRRLTSVKVIGRFPRLSQEQYRSLRPKPMPA